MAADKQVFVSVSMKKQLEQDQTRATAGIRSTLKNSKGLLIIAAVVLAGALAATFMLRHGPATGNPLTGRWQARIIEADGKTHDCIFDLPASGTATFSDSCPSPLDGATGHLAALKTKGAWEADALWSRDVGSFTFQGSGGILQGAYRTPLFGGLITRDNRLGEVRWKAVSAATAMPKPAEGVIPPSAQWPLDDVSGVIRRANGVMRAKWQADAVLMELKVRPVPSGGVDLALTYYSPAARQVRIWRPRETTGDLSEPAPDSRDTRRAIPNQIMELSAAMNRSGSKPGDIEEADLAWMSSDFDGVQWRLRTSDGGVRFAPAGQGEP